MALKKRFLHVDYNCFIPATRKLIAGVIVGLLFAVSFYGLMYLSRESIRYLSIDVDNNIVVLSDTEVRFFNLVFAFISVILA